MMRIVLAVGALALLVGCAALQPAKPQKPQTLAEILQAEGSHPTQVPLYLVAPNGTFRTNGLMPEQWGDTGP